MMQVWMAKLEIADGVPAALASCSEGERCGVCGDDTRLRTHCAKRETAGANSTSGTMAVRATATVTSKARIPMRRSIPSLVTRVLPGTGSHVPNRTSRRSKIATIPSQGRSQFGDADLGDTIESQDV